MVHQQLDRFFLRTDFHNIPHILATYFQRPMQLETEVLLTRLKEEGDTLWKHCASSDHLTPPSKSVDAQPIRALQQWFHVRNGQLKSPQSSVLHTEFSCLPTWMVAIITSASSDFNTWMASWRSKSGWAFLSFFQRHLPTNGNKETKPSLSILPHAMNGQCLKSSSRWDCENMKDTHRLLKTSFQQESSSHI